MRGQDAEEGGGRMSRQVAGRGSMWGGGGGLGHAQGRRTGTDPGAGAGCKCQSWCKEGPAPGPRLQASPSVGTGRDRAVSWCAALPGVQTIPSNSSHVIRCICNRQFDVKVRHGSLRACSSGRGSCLPRTLAGMCHAAFIRRQHVNIGKHHILVDRTAHEKSRVRCVPADAADELRGPDQHSALLSCWRQV